MGGDKRWYYLRLMWQSVRRRRRRRRNLPDAEVLTAMVLVGVRLGTNFGSWSHVDGYVLEPYHLDDLRDPRVRDFIARVWGGYEYKLNAAEAYERAAIRFAQLPPAVRMSYLRGV